MDSNQLSRQIAASSDGSAEETWPLALLSPTKLERLVQSSKYSPGSHSYQVTELDSMEAEMDKIRPLSDGQTKMNR